MSKKIDFVKDDEKLAEVVLAKGGLSKSRRDDYNIVFNEIYRLSGYTPTSLFEKAKEDEVQYLNPENNRIVETNLNERTVSTLQLEYYNYLKKRIWNGRKLGDSTIKNKLNIYRAFFNQLKIDLPDPIKLNIKHTRPKEDEVPTWDDVALAISYSKSPRDQAIIGFAAVTGIRIGDILSLKIKDLLDSCKIYFEDGEEKTLENLLKKNPDNIVPCWELNPSKTDRFSNLTITFNTPEVTDYIFKYLNWRINLDKKKGGDGVIPTNEALFRRQRNDNGEGHLSTVTSSQHFSDRNKELGDEKDKNGVYGKFVAKRLRTLFKSTIKHNLQFVEVNQEKDVYMDVVDLFTGHNDKSAAEYAYDTLPIDSHDSYLRKIYEQLIPYLSIHNTEVKVFRSKEYRDMEDQLEESQNRVAELEDLVVQLKENQEEMQESVERKSRAEMKKIIQRYFADNYRDNLIEGADLKNNPKSDIFKRCVVLPELAYEFALEDRAGFSNDDDYLNSLIKKAIVKVSFNPDIVSKYKEIHDRNIENYEFNAQINNITRDIIVFIGNNETMWSFVKDSQDKLKNTIITYLLKSDHVLEKIDSDDIKNIAEQVMLEMLNID